MSRDECPLYPRCHCIKQGFVDYRFVKSRADARPLRTRVEWVMQMRNKEKTLKEIAAENDISYVRVYQVIVITERIIARVCGTALITETPS